MAEIAKCAICGEPMPRGEEMFKFHGYSGPCPKPPLPVSMLGDRILERDGDGIRSLHGIPQRLTRVQALRLAGQIAAILDPNLKDIRAVVEHQLCQTDGRVNLGCNGCGKTHPVGQCHIG